MADDTKPTEEQVAAALKEYEDASDRCAVIAKYPFLVPILNQTTK